MKELTGFDKIVLVIMAIPFGAPCVLILLEIVREWLDTNWNCWVHDLPYAEEAKSNRVYKCRLCEREFRRVKRHDSSYQDDGSTASWFAWERYYPVYVPALERWESKEI